MHLTVDDLESASGVERIRRDIGRAAIHIRLRRSKSVQAAQSFQDHATGQPDAAVIYVRSNRFKEPLTIYVVEPDECVRGDFAIRRNGNDIEILSVERRCHSPEVFLDSHTRGVESAAMGRNA